MLMLRLMDQHVFGWWNRLVSTNKSGIRKPNLVIDIKK